MPTQRRIRYRQKDQDLHPKSTSTTVILLLCNQFRSLDQSEQNRLVIFLWSGELKSTSMVFLHFFGMGDPLRRFELEQHTGLCIAGFRPLALDAILDWSGRVAQQQHWDAASIQQMVISAWVDQAAQIQRWQYDLTGEPEQMELVAGLGSRGDWQRHWNAMLRVS